MSNLMRFDEIDIIECAQCDAYWCEDDEGDTIAGAVRHAVETLHDVEIVCRWRLDSIAMAVDGIDPEDVMSEPEIEIEEPEVFDDRGVPRLLITLAPPSPMSFFPDALRAIGELLPETAVIRSGRRGYEVWSRQPSEEDIRRELLGFEWPT